MKKRYSSRLQTRNKAFYDYFLAHKIEKVKAYLTPQEMERRITLLASFAWRNHTGYFFDGRLENVLHQYGRELELHVEPSAAETAMKTVPAEQDFSTVHVATELYNVGGHTRILYQFLKRHRDKRQVLVLTDQRREPVPAWFSEGIGDTRVVVLDVDTNCFERAHLLRSISRFGEQVILYTHPNDPVPIMAFADDDCPPVLLENHSHSWFWMGPSIADVVLAHSPFHVDLTVKTRPVPTVALWPFTQLDDIDPFFSHGAKGSAKAQLGIDAGKVCIMTIGTFEKFIPNAEYNFYETAKKVLQRFQNVEILVVGVSEADLPRQTYDIHSKRIHFVGPVADPSIFYKAADICLDALPQPSIGGTMYSVLIGLACPLFKYGTNNIFNQLNYGKIGNMDAYLRLVGSASTEEEYLEKLEILVNHPEVRQEVAEDIRGEYLKMYSPEKLKSYIEDVLELGKSVKHCAKEIPEGTFFEDADSAEIAETSQLQDLRQAVNFFGDYLSYGDKARLLARLMAYDDCRSDVLSFLSESIAKLNQGWNLRPAKKKA